MRLAVVGPTLPKRAAGRGGGGAGVEERLARQPERQLARSARAPRAHGHGRHRAWCSRGRPEQHFLGQLAGCASWRFVQRQVRDVRVPSISALRPNTITSSMDALRMAEQPMFTATGSAAIWHGAVSRCTARGGCGAAEGRRSDARGVDGGKQLGLAARRPAGLPRGLPTSRSSACLARPATLSNVAPTPTPTMSGGQALAAFSRTQSSTTFFTPSQPGAGRAA